MRKYYYILLFSLLLTGFTADAQRQRPGQVAAQKTAFITNALDLSSKEAQQFWPVYNAYEKRVEGIRKEERQALMNIRLNGGAMSDSEASELIDKFMGWQQNLLDERKKLFADLKGVISPQKIIRLQRAEDEFKRRLLQAMQNRKNKN